MPSSKKCFCCCYWIPSFAWQIQLWVLFCSASSFIFVRFSLLLSLNMAWRMRHIKRALVRVLYIAARTYLCVLCALCTLLSTSHAHTHSLSVIFFVKFFIFRAYSCLLLHLHADLPYIFIKNEGEMQKKRSLNMEKTGEKLQKSGKKKKKYAWKKHSKAKAVAATTITRITTIRTIAEWMYEHWATFRAKNTVNDRHTIIRRCE